MKTFRCGFPTKNGTIGVDTANNNMYRNVT